jgi:TM2 domain-containing membrane protein YozV
VKVHDTGEQLAADQLPFLQGVFMTPPAYPQAFSPATFSPGVIQVPAGSHSVGTAVLLALLITGLGQMYNKQGMKGLMILLISVLLAFFTCGLSILITHPFALIDAILIAGRLNRGEPISEWQCF